MKATRNTFAAAVLSAVGVLPIPAQSSNADRPDPLELERAALVKVLARVPLELRLNPITLEGATVLKAIKEAPLAIRAAEATP